MDLFGILTLCCGLALFLFGMNTMGDGLEKFSGGKLEKALEKMTNSTFKGFLLGAAVTAVIQSSSATTVMVVGFVNSGIMKLRQAIGIIMGANVGTTVTAWILSLSGIEGDSVIMQLLKPSSFSAIFALVGIIFLMFCKSDSKKNLGSICIGFAVLMTGMSMMSDAVEPLADDPTFTGILTLFNNPVFGILAGALLTAIIQSSSASVGILQALSSTGTITDSMAIPIGMGQNIGTCVTALISCIGAKKNAKRTALVHLYFNIIGTIVICALFYGSNLFLHYGFLDDVVNEANIAVIHTVFNLLATALLLPFNRQLEKLAYLTIRDKEEESETPFLDERFLKTPAVATQRAVDTSIKMARLSEGTFLGALELVDNYDEKTAQTISENEDMIDAYEDVISTYLVKLSRKTLSEKDSKTIQLILHTIGDFERISDHAINIVEVAKEIEDKKVHFSTEAIAGIEVMVDAVKEIINNATLAFINNDVQLATKVEPLEQVIDRLRDKLKEAHIRRLTNGECTIELGFIFSDLITNIERVSDHCSNIAIGVIEINNDGYEAHEYLHELKNSDDVQYNADFKEYKKKYALPEIAR
ncbi:MAG: Na/Pi cotransporter family protein [Acutalibacteraceae bacterium]|nr:Na/Pi cotransporter family protein [Acutalibacteraceae bacterium]